jgi:hypothetical protein
MSAHAIHAPVLPRLVGRTRVRTCDKAAAHERAPQSADEEPLDDLELLAADWQRALDSADRALVAAVGTLPTPYLEKRRRALAEERRQTAELLVAVARARGSRRACPCRRNVARSLTP